MELERPEDEPLPGDWKRMPEFDRLMLFRCVIYPVRCQICMQNTKSENRKIYQSTHRDCRKKPLKFDRLLPSSA